MSTERKGDRHKKKPLQLRLHEQLRQQLERLADRNASNLTAEISIAIRERLERAGLWPPPAPTPPSPPPVEPDASQEKKARKRKTDED